MSPRRGTALVLGAVLAVHLAVSARAIAPASLLGSEPFHSDDFSLHFARAATVASTIPETRRLWTYDPGHMAGYPLGATVFDLDNVGTAVGLALLRPLGDARAFNLLVALCLALAPLVIWTSARLLGADPVEAVTAAAAATVVAATAVTFRLGMFANFAVSHLAVLVVVLAARHLGRPTPGSFLILVAVATAGMFLHVFLGILVLVPCGILVIGHALERPRRTMVHAVAITLALLALNAIWLGPFLRFAPVIGWDYPHHFFQTGPLAQALQTLTILSGWPLVLLGLAAIGFASSARRLGRPLAVAYGSWLALLLFASLQGSRVPFIGRFEPVHLGLPLAFALSPLAGIGVMALLRKLRLPHAALVAAPLVFAPHLLVTLRTTAAVPPIAASLPPEGAAVVAWLREHTDRSARVMIEDRLHLERPRLDRDVPDHPWFGGHVPALLPRLLDREVIGGPYPEMPIAPHLADFTSARFFGEPLASWAPDRFAAQLERYNIGWIVAWSREAISYLEAQTKTLRPLGRVGRFHAFAALQRPSFFFLGSGEIGSRPDALEVRGASAGRVVLKYHWYPGLCSNPPLPLGPFHAGDLAVPFIAVDNGTTSAFTIRAARGWLGGCG